MKFEDWWNTENIIEFSNEPDDYSKAMSIYNSVYNAMKNCLNCGKKNKCVQWHKVIKYAGTGEINFNCVQLDKWEDEDYAEE